MGQLQRKLWYPGDGRTIVKMAMSAAGSRQAGRELTGARPYPQRKACHRPQLDRRERGHRAGRRMGRKEGTHNLS